MGSFVVREGLRSLSQYDGHGSMLPTRADATRGQMFDLDGLGARHRTLLDFGVDHPLHFD